MKYQKPMQQSAEFYRLQGIKRASELSSVSLPIWQVDSHLPMDGPSKIQHGNTCGFGYLFCMISNCYGYMEVNLHGKSIPIDTTWYDFCIFLHWDDPLFGGAIIITRQKGAGNVWTGTY